MRHLGRVQPGPQAWAALSLGVLLSAWACWYTARETEQRSLLRIQRQVQRTELALSARFGAYEDILRGAAGVFATPGRLSALDWRRFVDKLDIVERHPGILALGFIVPVPREDAARFLAEEQREGSEIRQVTTSGDHPILYLIRYQEPRRPPTVALGFDVGAVRVNREAVERTRDTGALALAVPLDLPIKKGMALQLAVYRPGLPTATVEERRRAFLGCVSVALLAKPLLDEVLRGGDGDVGLEVYSLSAAGEPARLYGGGVDESPSTGDHPGAREAVSLVAIGGQTLRLVFRTLPGFGQRQGQSRPFWVLAGGLAVTLLAFGFAWSLSRTRERAKGLAAEMTRSLSAALQRNRVFLDNTPLGVIEWDDQFRVVSWNASAERIFGYSAAQARGMHASELLASPDPAAGEELWASIRRAEGRRLTVEGRTAEGALVTCDWYSTPLFAADFTLAGAASLVDDITERRQLEERLRQSQKMEAVGRLAGGVAHDFNNLLTAILGYSELLRGRVADDPVANRNLREIEDAAERAAALTRQLLAFSRRQVLRFQVVDLNEVVLHAEALLQRLIGEDVTLETLLEPQLGAVRGDPGQIEQVIINLAVNARDAMPQGGRLTLSTRNCRVDLDSSREANGFRPAGGALDTEEKKRPDTKRPDAKRQGAEAMTPGDYVRLSVADTGVGMEAEIRAHVFEPFFTTKEVGKGTGLGLATVYGIVKQSGGYIWMESEPGEGARFDIYLPRVEQPVAAVPPAPQAGLDAGRGTETILLVEDEEAVREMTTEILEKQGYTVLPAPHPREALFVSQRHGGPIALMLTDVVMPEMNGRDLARRMSELRPNIKVLYMSGYTDEALGRHGVLEKDIAFIGKPFTPARLCQRVREVLDGAGTGSPPEPPSDVG